MPYTVKRGDSLNKIAAAHGTTLADLLMMNPNITNPNLIQIGQSIVVETDEGSVENDPAGEGKASSTNSDAGGEEETYTVIKGDTLGKIAKANGMTLAELLKLNPGIKDANKISINQKIILSTGGGSGATKEDPAKEAATGGEPLPGVLSGGKLVRRRFGPGGIEDDIWYQIYEYPAGSGNFVSYEFSGPDQLKAALGEGLDIETVSDSWYDQHVIAEGQAEEVIGADGTWTTMIGEMQKDAARLAGINDPALAGQIASNPEMQQIMVQATLGDWTDAQVIAAQRKTNFWKNELYPGIENLYDKTTNPEAMYEEYVGSVVPALKRLGYESGADGRFSDSIKKMLDGNIDADTFNSQVPTFIQAVQNADFATTLSDWYGAGPITFDNWFALMEGKGQPELNAIAEKAQLDWVAQNQGFDITKEQIERLGAKTQLSQAEMAQIYGQVTAAVIATGDEALGRYGLSRDDILSANANLETSSGRGPQEVRLLAAKIAREQSLLDEDKINFYVGFNPDGTPTRPGLQSLAPEGA